MKSLVVRLIRPIHRRRFLFLLLFTLSVYIVFHWNVSRVARNVMVKEKSKSIDKPEKPEIPPSWISQTPLIDKHKKSEIELLYEASKLMRNLPHPPYILGNTMDKNRSCASFPELSELQFADTYWQILKTKFGTLYLYGAYYDNRNLTLAKLKAPVVRLLGMNDRYLRSYEISAHCQLWFENEKEPVFSKFVDQKHIWSRAWFRGNLQQPYLFACVVPESHRDKIPTSVSVVTNRCDNATNHLSVQHETHLFKQEIGVCVKALDFYHEDISVRLVEWLEFMRILGADKIFMYELAVHPNVSKVLNYYKAEGFVDVTPITFAGSVNEPRLRHIYLKNPEKLMEKRQHEIVAYNDCLYRNLYNYKYLVLIDIDEVIVPISEKGSDWKELTRLLEEEYPDNFDLIDSIAIQEVLFFDQWMENSDPKLVEDIPEFTHTLRNIIRAKSLSSDGKGSKSFHRPDRIFTIHNHYPLSCTYFQCRVLFVRPELVQMNHYRMYRFNDPLETEYHKFDVETVEDTIVWKYKDELIIKTGNVLQKLGFLKEKVPTPWRFFPRIPIHLFSFFKL